MFNRLEFIKSQMPRKPWGDWRVYALFVPACFSAVGFFVFAVLGYSFTEFSMIPEWVRFWLVIAGGVCLAGGGEIGTLFSTMEVFRKQKLAQTGTWDWIALGVSLASTLASFVLAFAALLGARAGWSRPVQVWGAIVLGVLAALDAYGLFLEVGFIFADYEQRMDVWFVRMEQEQQTAPVDLGQLGELQAQVAKLAQEIEYSKMPIATLNDFRQVVVGLNGKRKDLAGKSARQVVMEVCELGGYRVNPDMATSTFANWAKEVKG